MDVSSPDGAAGRSRRKKIDKTGRVAAFEKLKNLKGLKNKYQVDEIEQVWTEVDETDYSKLVQQRQEDDWIVGDDALGYVEDGREIFDEEYDDRSSKKSSESSYNRKKQKLECSGSSTSSTNQKRDLKSMLIAMPTKKKPEKDIKLEDDNILNDILQSLGSNSACQSVNKTLPFKKKLNVSIKTVPVRSRSKVTGFNGLQPVTTPTRPMSQPKVLKPRHVLSDVSQMSTSSSEKELESVKYEMDVDDFADVMDDFDEPMDNEEDINSEHIADVADTKLHLKDLENHLAFEQVNCDKYKMESSLSGEWSNVCSKVTEDTDELIPNMMLNKDDAKLPLTVNENGDTVLRFFWLDAYEDHLKQPGVVYLFGKIQPDGLKTFVSCCVIVKDIERKVFVLPRENKYDLKTDQSTDESVTFLDVYKEISDLLTEKYKVLQFRSRKIQKLYCFDRVGVPDVAEYLEIKYSAQYPSLPSDLKGQTFSCVFGVNTPSLETLLLDRCIMGPCWLEIKQPQPGNPQLSWCKIEAVTNKLEHVTVMQNKVIPFLVIMSLGLKTVLNSKSHQNEIVAATCLVHMKFSMEKAAPNPPFQEHFCALTRPSESIFPFDFKDHICKQNSFKVEKMDSERSLLGFLLAKINKFDPDIIVGHDLVQFDMDLLMNRMAFCKISNWSRIGRLKRTVIPKNTYGNRGSIVACGRLLCDVKIVAKELIRSKSYDLTELTRLVLKKERIELEPSAAFNSSADLLQFIEWSLLDASYCLQLIYEINALPLALQITNIAGNVMSRTLLGGRSERNEFLLLHAFTAKEYIVPDKQIGGKKATNTSEVIAKTSVDVVEDKKANKKKSAYVGGLVLEPKRGFYDKFILLMDFNSLYPSIIQEFNVCFTTMCGVANDGKLYNENDAFDVHIPDTSCPPGILATEIRKLVESRRQVKQLLKASDLTEDLKIQYDIRQKALKLTANSMYGCLGFENSRFYAKPLAAFITGKGREILLQTKDLVQRVGHDVIYGDTDSIMINSGSTDLDQVLKIGNKLKSEINKLYHHLEIEIDGVFKSILLLKKKKYAALTIQKLPSGEMVFNEEIKGVDVVRRDWSDLASDAGRFVIHEILSGKQIDQIIENIHSFMCDLKVQIMEEKIPLSKFTITKQLTKNPEDYPDKNVIPHVNVALRLNSRGGKKLKQGDTVPYVICEDSSKLSAMQRAYHLDELRTNENLVIDKSYYLSQQVHPVVSRLCDPIDGLDAVVIAECLGIDSSSYRKNNSVRNEDAEDDAMLGRGLRNYSSLFESCEPFKFRCPSSECGQEIVWDAPFIEKDAEQDCVLRRCSNRNCFLSPASYVNQLNNILTREIRQFVRQYYKGWLICDDLMCNSRTRKVPLKFMRDQPICAVCENGCLYQEYSDMQLYNQLRFYQYIFDPEKVVKLGKAVTCDWQQYQKEFNQLRATVTKFIDSSAYAMIDLTQLFDGLHPKVKPQKD